MTAVNQALHINYEDEINRMRREMNAVILAHYYQEPELQDIADFVGDSLDLSRKAAATDADVIVFCGVKFMAEVAHILSPEKLVLLPDMEAGCSLEQTCQAADFKRFREQNPDHVSLTYINCSAEVKALSDVIVTSANAESIVRQIPEDKPILFAPDKHLGSFLQKQTGRDMTLWQGTCIVHEQFSEKELVQKMHKHADAKVIAHPECPENLLEYADFIGSTGKLLGFVKEHPTDTIIVMTEPGILHYMQQFAPEATLIPIGGLGKSGCDACNNCPFMKLNTMEKLYDCMKTRAPSLTLPSDVREQAAKSLNKMLEMSV